MPGCVEKLAHVGRFIQGNLDEVLQRWQGLYRERLGEGAFFDSASFERAYSEEIAGVGRWLATHDTEELVQWLHECGVQARRKGVPFAELPMSFHLFGKAMMGLLDTDTCEAPAATAEGLDALAHSWTALRAKAYFGERYCNTSPGKACLIDELASLQRQAAQRDRFCGMVGLSLPMQRLYENLTVAARTRATVLLTGETGTGKELAARAVHRLSGDPLDRYVPVNCAALPTELMESELFGHRKGAFSGATSHRKGLFQAAEGGTLFLDEVTELSPPAQAKLLRALQERAVRPVGARSEVPISIRVVASTNIPLQEAVDQGQLRRDLYYRLQGFVIQTPTLLERTEDIPLLTQHFLEQTAMAHPDLSVRGMTRAAMDVLQAHPWPGNVRELQLAVERACFVCLTSMVDVGDLALDPGRPGTTTAHEPPPGVPVSLKDAERRTIANALAATAGNKTRASKILGISRKQLYVKIERYGLGDVK
jgi:DNA-binding NtrC family response regulator